MAMVTRASRGPGRLGHGGQDVLVPILYQKLNFSPNNRVQVVYSHCVHNVPNNRGGLNKGGGSKKIKNISRGGLNKRGGPPKNF